MCGISGILGPDAASQTAIERMTRSIAHRGPDGEGIWSDPEARIALGNRRLAIIDLSPAGAQPMQSADGRFVFSFNGEIYNHPELRAALDAEGRSPSGGWRGHSDTETFLEAIAAWGLGSALERSAGMFAFALWDRQERVLRLVRDRFGEKPLYYGWAGRNLLFASELKALRQHPAFNAEIDRRALSAYVERGFIPAPWSIYAGTFKLPPAAILTIESGAEPLLEPPDPDSWVGGVGLKHYWSYRDLLERGQSDLIHDEEDALAELEDRLARAVASQALADVPVGAFLSGGIDSSTIVALYQKYSSVAVRTFTIGFEEAAYNEADDARRVALHFGTEHHERIVSAEDAIGVIPMLADIYDEPFADYSQIPTFLVSQFARGQVTVALSGDGGDELFGGYNRYTGLARAWAMKERSPLLVGGAARLLSHVPAEAIRAGASLLRRRRLPPAFGFKAARALSALRAESLDEFVSEFSAEWTRSGFPAGERAAPSAGAPLAGADSAQRLMLADIQSYLPDDILVKVDRASMAVGLEAHAPFLDHRVAELSARLAPRLKVRGGTGKYLLRRLLAREAPPALFDRPKAGFTLPLGEWLRGPLREWAETMLAPSRLAQSGLLDPAPIATVWRDHLRGKRDASLPLWSILMFEAWRERWK